ncbi:hypothetical protein LCGC14_0803830 [marine sediment metagenome]|uniref:Uncharacterized protein n=1 Tax=marine sediment metagenome TaxID=412755 RepID=A0A0F9S8U1_9ZZZZ
MSAPTGYSRVPTQTGQQQDALSQLLSMITGSGAEGFESALQNLIGLLSGSDESFEAFEAPLMRQFQEQILPSVQERLTAMGQGGGRSTGAKHVLAQSAERFGEGLASQRAGLQQNAIQQLLGTYLQGQGLGLGTQAFGFAEQPSGFFANLGQGLGQGVGQGIGGGGFSDLIKSFFPQSNPQQRR